MSIEEYKIKKRLERSNCTVCKEALHLIRSHERTRLKEIQLRAKQLKEISTLRNKLND